MFIFYFSGNIRQSTLIQYRFLFGLLVLGTVYIGGITIWLATKSSQKTEIQCPCFFYDQTYARYDQLAC
jgi:hypothetical protein